ncbi:MAG: DUF4331 domain-containing protein, partial [Chloroflexi bacterium]
MRCVRARRRTGSGPNRSRRRGESTPTAQREEGTKVHSHVATVRTPLLAALALAVGTVAFLLLLVYGAAPQGAKASSHAEAPLISQDPRADNTDLYAFVSPENTNTVTMVANYIPLEAPASGPNFYSFDDSVLYEINVDNNGDGED